MHPVEHLLYISTILVHFFIPSTPLHFVYQGLHTCLGAQKGHTGYERLVVDPKLVNQYPSAGYFHYLHHKYFECNYGELTSLSISGLALFMMTVQKKLMKSYLNLKELHKIIKFTLPLIN